MKSYETPRGEVLPLTQHQPQHIEVLALEILRVDPEGITFSVLAADAPSVATIRLRLDWGDLIASLADGCPLRHDTTEDDGPSIFSR